VRLFVALEIPDNVRETIARLVGELKPLDNSWKWTRAENLHITLKFLGETPQEKMMKSVCEALRSVSCAWPIPVKFHGLGFFPKERRPRVLWIGMEAPPSLGALAAGIEEALTSVGVPREERAFTPHLTLARNKEGRISEKFQNALSSHATREFGTMNAMSFHLIESKLKSTGAEYTTLESFSGSGQR
jgi:2'-5' RNA ligase